MAYPIVLVANAAADLILADDLPLTPQACQNLVTAALVADAAKNFEDAMAKDLPIVTDKAQAADTRGVPPIWNRQLRDDAVSDRAGKALMRALERSGQPLPPALEFDFLKLRVTEIVTRQIRERGLFVYTQRLLFSPEFATTGMQVLEKMKLPELPPVAASVAVATGEVPPLPSRNLKEHLQFLNTPTMRGWRGPRGSFADWVAKAAPAVVEFPAPNVAAGRTCRSDRFSTGYRRSAELGMGFFLATDFDQIGDRLNIVTPMLFHHAALDGNPQPWRAEFLSEQVHRRFTPRDENARLQKAMGESPRLKVCPSCAEIYSDDRADLKLRCQCQRGR
ncbi:hypothetical protein [Burkholderia contaminans]|uniref:hypothetical protein n=1 Tax=Burkholderia contaminans TaxID=488447 RepID=UPI003D666A0E